MTSNTLSPFLLTPVQTAVPLSDFYIHVLLHAAYFWFFFSFFLQIQGSRVLSQPGPMEIDLFTISKAPYYHNEAIHQGFRCLVDAHRTFYLGGSTIGADEAKNDRDEQTDLSQYWVHMR